MPGLRKAVSSLLSQAVSPAHLHSPARQRKSFTRVSLVCQSWKADREVEGGQRSGEPPLGFSTPVWVLNLSITPTFHSGLSAPKSQA